MPSISLPSKERIMKGRNSDNLMGNPMENLKVLKSGVYWDPEMGNRLESLMKSQLERHKMKMKASEFATWRF